MDKTFVGLDIDSVADTQSGRNAMFSGVAYGHNKRDDLVLGGTIMDNGTIVIVVGDNSEHVSIAHPSSRFYSQFLSQISEEIDLVHMAKQQAEYDRLGKLIHRAVRGDSIMHDMYTKEYDDEK